LADEVVRRSDGLAVEEGREHVLHTSRIAGLGVEGGAGVVRYHSVATAQRVLHSPPWVIARSRLDVPDIPRVPSELTVLYSPGDCIFITDRTTSGVHQPCTPLEMPEQLVVDQPTGTLVERSVDGNDVAPGDKFLEIQNALCTDGIGSI